jgi:orotidine-5'-phosphate decarboxylase
MPNTSKAYPEQCRIAIALDVTSSGDLDTILSIFQNLEPARRPVFKVGLEFFTANQNLSILSDYDIFFDIKLHDIPNTVYAASMNILANSNVKMFTVHACGSNEMLKSAMKAKSNSNSPAWVLGVTKLTSEVSTPDDVLRLVSRAIECGLDGIVCSGLEARLIREKFGEGIKIITPGIRPTWYNVQDDQSRVLSPSDAMNAGSDILVIGRPILKSENILSAYLKILEEIS